MTLTTHALVGAAAASLIPYSPTLALAAAFMSHFVIDAIPHWDYKIKSLQGDPKHPMKADMVIGKDFFIDLVRIGFDALLGVVLSLFFFSGISGVSMAFWGACLGILPDPLQFVYWKIRREPLISLQRFHIWIHAKTQIREYWYVGVVFQVALVFFSISIARWAFLLHA